MHSQRFQRGYVPIFLSYYKPHMKLFILDMCCALGIALVDLAFPAASRQALNELLPKNLYAAFFCRHGHPPGGLRPALGDVFHRHLLGPHDGGAH